MYLMNKDIPVLWFDTGDKIIEVLNNDMLPFQLRDYIKSSSELTTLSQMINNYDALRHFFADRVLTLSRQNAKQILISIQNTQKLTEEESYKLSLSCRGVSISDSYWVKQDEENIVFSEIDVRNTPLSSIVFQVSMKGTPITLQRSILAPDIATGGMFSKTWVRESDGLWLYKSDSTSEKINTKMELEVSKLLDNSNVSHVQYKPVTKDDVFCCKCKCMTSDKISFVDAEYVRDYYSHINKNFESFIMTNFSICFANMVVVDYIFANPDRHNNNWGFMIDTDTNKIISLSPIFDNNQAGIALLLGKDRDFENLMYPPTNTTILEAINTWAEYSTAEFNNLPEPYLSRYEKVLQTKENSRNNPER